jgi:hypothetical protein
MLNVVYMLKAMTSYIWSKGSDTVKPVLSWVWQELEHWLDMWEAMNRANIVFQGDIFFFFLLGARKIFATRVLYFND